VESDFLHASISDKMKALIAEDAPGTAASNA